MAHQHIVDPNSLTVLKTDLFIRQERQSPLVGLAGSGRVRRPSELNVSDRFRERMQPVIMRPGAGRASVALSFHLPAGAHPTVMLREAFDVRHAQFHDLLTPHAADWHQ